MNDAPIAPEEELADEAQEEVETGGAANNGSLEADLRDELRTIRSEKEEFTFIDIPALKGRLVAKYRRLEYAEIDKIRKAVGRMIEKKHPKATLYGQADVLAKALMGIYLRKDSEKPDELEPLEQGYPGLGDGPILWDGLAKFLAKDGEETPDTARKCVLFVINNDLAVPPHQVDLAVWMSSARAEDEEDFLLDF